MSTNFPTAIGSMSPQTISKPLTYSKTAAAETPNASAQLYYNQPKKKSHWFRNLVIAAVVVVGGAAAARKWSSLKDISLEQLKAKPEGNLGAKAKHYIAKFGEGVIKTATDFGKWISGGKKAKDGTEKAAEGATK